jgi:hypothetical protein
LAQRTCSASDFVAHIGEEAALGAIGGFGRGARLSQGLFGQLALRDVDVFHENAG